MENTNENKEGIIKQSGNWKKILGLVLNIALLVLIDGLMIYTFISDGNTSSKETVLKILMIVMGNILFLVLLFWGEQICNLIKDTIFLKVGDILLFVATPLIVCMLVQMVTWLSGYKNKAVESIKGLVKMSLKMHESYLPVNLLLYAAFFILLILLLRKVGTATAAMCYLLVALALVNYYVMEFRGEPFLLLDAVGRELLQK